MQTNLNINNFYYIFKLFSFVCFLFLFSFRFDVLEARSIILFLLLPCFLSFLNDLKEKNYKASKYFLIFFFCFLEFIYI